MSIATRAWIRGNGMTSAEKFVIFACSIGTLVTNLGLPFKTENSPNLGPTSS